MLDKLFDIEFDLLGHLYKTQVMAPNPDQAKTIVIDRILKNVSFKKVNAPDIVYNKIIDKAHEFKDFLENGVPPSFRP